MEGVVSFTIGQYKGLNRKRDKVVVTDEEMQSGLMEMIDPYLNRVSKNNGITTGDYIEMSYEMKDKYNHDVLKGKRENYCLRIGFGYFIQGFEKHLMGKRKGDTVEFSMCLSDDYSMEASHNDKVNVRVFIKDVKHKTLIYMTDAYIQTLQLENIRTVKELKAQVRTKIYWDKLSLQREALINEIVGKILDNCKIVYDEDMVNYYAHLATEEYMNKHLNQTLLGKEEYKIYQDKIKAHYKEETQTTLLELALFEDIIEKENIVVDEEEKVVAKEKYCIQKKKLPMSVNIKEIERSLLYQKVLELLILENMDKEDK